MAGDEGLQVKFQSKCLRRTGVARRHHGPWGGKFNTGGGGGGGGVGGGCGGGGGGQEMEDQMMRD